MNEQQMDNAGAAAADDFRPGGHFETQVVRDGVEGPWEVEKNLVPSEGLMHFLTTTLAQGTQKGAFYIALFGGDYTPAAGLTAATFPAAATEFTNYDENNRVLWAKDAASGNAIGNNTTAAVFTIATGGGTVRGAALVSEATKSSTSGVLIAAARFGTAKVLEAGEELRIKYVLSGASA